MPNVVGAVSLRRSHRNSNYLAGDDRLNPEKDSRDRTGLKRLGKASDPDGLYFDEIAHTLLTKEEEFALSEQIHNGDKDALNKLVSSNLRLVVNVSKGFLGKGVEFLDLIQEGNVKLIDIAEKYDYKRGYRFSTFATNCLIKHFIRFTGASYKVAYVPPATKVLVGKAIAKFNNLYARDPSPEEISRETDISLKKVVFAIAAFNPQYLDDCGEKGYDAADKSMSESPDIIINEESLSILNNALKELDDREQEILKRRFGLEGYEKETLKEVGESLGVTKERIRQIEGKALNLLFRILST